MKIERLPVLPQYPHKRGPYFAVRTGKQSVMLLREGGPVLFDAREEYSGRATSPLSVRWKKLKRGLVLTACANNIPVGPHADAPPSLTQMQAVSYFLWALGY